jgi:uncharacterized protein YbjQ (UPF0145 family)
MSGAGPPPSDEAPGETEEEQGRSLEQVERGGIPLGAERRLSELSAGRGAFTSDLSVGSFALCHELGLTPLAQVMGSSVYQVGYQSTVPMNYGGGFMFELDGLTRAWNEVRELAFSRLAQEAQQVGADAVVGVQISSGAREFTEGAIECVVIGTAVRSGPRDGSGAAHARAGHEVLTELSVPDYAKLRRAGIETLGVVAWTSVFFVQASYQTQMLSGGGMGFSVNRELPEYTQGIYQARESVMARVSAQARQLGADGIVGVRIGHSARRTNLGAGPYQQGGLMVSFNAIGTAIRQDATNEFPSPKMTIDLTEGAD